MKIVLQRVTHASVTVDGNVTGKINNGYLLLFGVGKNDTKEDCNRFADKIVNLRIFSDVNGSILVVPQFTLYADCRKGNRPNFIQAGSPDYANELFEYFTQYLRNKGQHVETGIFGADMKVELLNDGPFTVILE